jgi:nucleotide-binding universal stress UspA family protein
MKKIVVPCDFSEQAVSAFRVALDIASESKGEVHLLHIVELPIMHDTVLMPVLSFEEALLKELQGKAEANFKKLSDKHAKDNQRVVSKVLFGPTARMITDYAESVQADVIVMGTHGASGVREFIIGSNAEKIVRHSSIPVLTIKKYVKLSSIKTIVFPNTLDTENQEDLVTHVKAIQNFFKARLHILWINTPTNFTADKITARRLEAFVKRYMLKDYIISVYNDPYEESGVINYAIEAKADMIAMGTHGRKGLAHILSGSVAEDVVNHVQCPIWTYSIRRK